MEELLISLAPIIIIIIVWIVIMRNFFRKNLKNNKFEQKQDAMISLLTEIKDELKQLNQNNSIK